MKEKKKTEKSISPLLIIGIILLGLFLWFQVRPTLIRKNCYKEAVDRRVYDLSKKRVVEILDDEHYERCLKKYGLK